MASASISLRSSIWYFLDNELTDSAAFAAERLLAFESEDSSATHLAALVAYRQAKFRKVLLLTSKLASSFLPCTYLYAQACLQLDKTRDGITILETTQGLWSRLENNALIPSDLNRRALPDQAAFAVLLGHLYKLNGDISGATENYVIALKYNPYMFEAFEGLCKMGVNCRVENIFKLPTDISRESLISVWQVYQTRQAHQRSSGIAKPKDDPFIDSTPIGVNRGGNPFRQLNDVQSDKISISSNIFSDNGNNNTQISPVSNFLTGNSRFGSNLAPPPPITDTNTKNSTSTSLQSSLFSKRLTTPRASSLEAPTAPTRRSSRINPTKFSSRLANITGNTNSRNTVSSRRKKDSEANDTMSTGTNNDKKELEAENLAKSKIILIESLEETLSCYRQIGEGLLCLSRYKCEEAMKFFSELPEKQRDTPFVAACMGRANFEMVNYPESEKWYARLRELDHSRTQDMEYYSTLLWHLQEEVKLSFLAHEMLDLDKSSPEVWIVVGNLFSLQRDHLQAIKCFKRAGILSPEFAYGHTLQGHEYMATDAYEAAQTAYRKALVIDPRHYNAWYGLGMVFFMISKTDMAETHFKRAVSINPSNAVLFCCIGMVLEKERNISGALAEYSKACLLQPRSALSRYKKARALVSLRRFEDALKELDVLKVIAPDEANVHFLLGTLYKYLGGKPSAIKHFTIALNLDPKGSHLIKEALESLDEQW